MAKQLDYKDLGEITPEEQEFINRIQAEMVFFERHKELMKEIKKVFLSQGPKAAKAYVRTQADRIVTIAVDEMFTDLFNKL